MFKVLAYFFLVAGGMMAGEPRQFNTLMRCPPIQITEHPL